MRAALIEQIKRDIETLASPTIGEDPCGRAFYEQRIADYRAVVKDIDRVQVRSLGEAMRCSCRRTLDGTVQTRDTQCQVHEERVNATTTRTA